MAQVGFWRGVFMGAIACLASIVVLGVGFVAYGQYTLGKRAEARIEAHATKVALHPPDLSRSDAGNAADFAWTLRGADGESVKFETFRGRVFVLTFWATWCMPCRAEIPTLEALRSTMGDSSVVNFFLVSSEKPDVVREYADSADLRLPYFTVEGGIPGVFATETRPTTFIVGCDGVIAYRHYGAADWNSDTVVEYLADLNDQCS